MHDLIPTFTAVWSDRHTNKNRYRFFFFFFLHSELRKYRVCFTEILFIFLMVKENTSRKFSNTFTSLIQTDNMCWIPLQSYLRIFLPRVGENKLKFLSESLSPIFPNVEKTTKSTCFVRNFTLTGKQSRIRIDFPKSPVGRSCAADALKFECEQL